MTRAVLRSDRPWRRLAMSDWTWRIAVFVLFALGWENWARNAQSLLIPSFTGTLRAIGTLVADPRLYEALVVSNQAMVIGYAISLSIGITLGLATGRSRTLRSIADGYLSILLVVPSAAFIPLIVIVLGLELAARVFLIVLFGFVIITVTTRAGAREVDPTLIEMARSFGAKERTIWWRILIPASLPAIMAGARIGLVRAVEGMVTVELLLASVGIGGMILRFQGSFDADLLYATVVILILESVTLAMLARRLEKRLTPWASRGGLVTT